MFWAVQPFWTALFFIQYDNAFPYRICSNMIQAITPLPLFSFSRYHRMLENTSIRLSLD